MGEAFVAARCKRHRQAVAGWRCAGCGAALCPDCVWASRTGSTTYVACGLCRELVEPITFARAVQRPFAARLGEALAYPFAVATFTAIAATAAVIWLVGFVPIIGWILASGVKWAFLFAVIRQTSRGARHFEQPDVADLAEYAAPALRGFVATAIVWVPATLRLVQTLAAEDGSFLGSLADPVLWLILLAGVLYAPAAILIASIGGGVLSMLNPVFVVRAVARLGADYAIAVGVVIASLAAGAALELAAGAAVGFVPVAGTIVTLAAGLYGPALAAHVLGLLLYVRGDALGLGPESDYQVPVLGDTPPRGREPVLETTAVAPAPPPEPIALEADAAPAAPARAAPPAPAPQSPAARSAAARVAAVEPRAPAPPPPAQPPADALARVAAALSAGALVDAARLYAAAREPAGLGAAQLYAVARGAAQGGAHALAARALHAAALSGDPAVAPDALLGLARLYQARLGRPADARQVLAHLASTYPASPAAEHARAALATAPPQG